VLCLAACGTPGAPRPPSLDLPKPVTDLSATRVGDKVTLRWTVPIETTDGTAIRHPGKTRICRDLVQPSSTSCTLVAELPPGAAAGTSRTPVTRTYVDQLPTSLQTEHATGFAQYAVVALNDRGKSAEVTNRVEVPLAPTVPPPGDIEGHVTASKVEVKGSIRNLWAALSATRVPLRDVQFHIYRRDTGAIPEVDLGVCAEFVFQSAGINCEDNHFEWEHRYVYRIAAITTVTAGGERIEVQGEPSEPIEVFTHDVFPPAAPTAIQAVASGVGQTPFVDLSWIANTESDLAGYNVYRHEEGQAAIKINTELVKAPAFRDSTVTSGHKYLYAVTAVDLRGNESSHSAEAAESVP